MPAPSPAPVSVERHPPERGPQSVILPSACCTCCCCCSCCLTTVGAVVAGAASLAGDDARRRARKRLGIPLALAVGVTLVIDLALGGMLIGTLIALPISMMVAGIVTWLAYAVRLFPDVEHEERRAIGRYLRYTLVGTVLGLVATILAAATLGPIFR